MSSNEAPWDIACINPVDGKLWISTDNPESIEFFEEYGGSRSINTRLRQIVDSAIEQIGVFQQAVFEGLGIKIEAETRHVRRQEEQRTETTNTESDKEDQEDPCVCPDCGTKCTSKSGLTRHGQSKHGWT